MIFKEMIGIEAESPFVCIEIKTCQPTAQTISCTTGIKIVYRILSTRYQCPQHTFEPSFLMDDIIRCSI